VFIAADCTLGGAPLLCKVIGRRVLSDAEAFLNVTKVRYA